MRACFGAMAQERPPATFACGGEIIGRGGASRILDGRTFVLADGREVRLAAIEVPPLPLPQESGAAPGGEAAKDALTALPSGAEIVLKQAEPQQTDRYGRVVAYAFTVRDGTEHSVQADPVAAGRARGGQSRQAGLRRGAFEPRKHRTPGQAWPLGQPVL